MPFPLVLLYGALGVGGLYFTYGRGDGATKRRFFPWYMVTCAVLFLALVWTTFRPGEPRVLPVFLVPAVAVAVVVNVRLTTFCLSCGAMVRRRLFSPTVACARCGAALDAPAAPPATPGRVLRPLLGWRGAAVLVALVVAAVQVASRRSGTLPVARAVTSDVAPDSASASIVTASGSPPEGRLAVGGMPAAAKELARVSGDSGFVDVRVAGARARVVVETPRGAFDVDVDSAEFATWAAAGTDSTPARDWLRGRWRGDGPVVVVASTGGTAFEAVRIVPAAATSSASSEQEYVVEATNGAWSGALRLSAASARRLEEAWRRRGATPVAEASDANDESTASVGEPPLPAHFEFQVDHPVTARAGNPSPTYPAALRRDGVDGDVLLQFVVDTTGRARMRTVRVLRYSHPAFARAVYAVLPSYQFEPASLAGRRVQQIVQLPFEFALAR